MWQNIFAHTVSAAEHQLYMGLVLEIGIV